MFLVNSIQYLWLVRKSKKIGWNHWKVQKVESHQRWTFTLGGKTTRDELHEAVLAMAKNKALEPDGVLIEIFTLFWNIIILILILHLSIQLNNKGHHEKKIQFKQRFATTFRPLTKTIMVLYTGAFFCSLYHTCTQLTFLLPSNAHLGLCLHVVGLRTWDPV